MSDTLKHYGVLGMKWGVRNRRNGPAIYSRKADRLARKIQRQKIKSAKYKYKSLKTGNLSKHNKLQAKAFKLDHKIAKNERKVSLTRERIKNELWRRENLNYKKSSARDGVTNLSKSEINALSAKKSTPKKQSSSEIYADLKNEKSQMAKRTLKTIEQLGGADKVSPKEIGRIYENSRHYYYTPKHLVKDIKAKRAGKEVYIEDVQVAYHNRRNRQKNK